MADEQLPGVVSAEQGQGPAQIPASGPMPQPNAPAPQMQPSGAAPTMPAQQSGSAPPAVGTGQPAAPAKPGSFFGNLSHAFMGAVLGGLAGKQETVGYSVDPDTGVQTPVKKDLHPRDQLAKIAQAALRGLAAGSASQGAPGDTGGAALGAGFNAQHDYEQKQDLLKRQQGQQQFEDEQNATLHKMNNANILLQTMVTRKNLLNADLATNQHMADIGDDTVAAMTAGGNSIVGQRDMPSADAAKFRNDHPLEYLNYTPLITKVEPAVKEDGTPDVDPTTGVQKVNRMYTFVDLKKPIKLDQSMIDHLQSINWQGADKLTAGQELDPRQFQALYWSGLKKYNDVTNDPANIDIKEAQVNGQNIWFSTNKVTGATHPVVDPVSGKPMQGKMPDSSETDQVFQKGVASGKYTNDANGRIAASTDLARSKAGAEDAARLGVEAGNAGDRAATAQRLVEADEDPTQLTKRSKDYNMRVDDADKYSLEKYGKHWDLAKAQSDYKFASAPATKNTLNYLNSVIPNMAQLVKQSDAIPRTAYPAMNNVLEWSRLAAGNPAIAAYHTTLTEVADQVAKILQGGGTGSGTSDAKLKQAQELFNGGFSADSIKAIAGDLTPLLNNRKDAMVGNNVYLKKWYPQNGQASANGIPSGARTVAGPNGHTLYTIDEKQWIDSTTGQPFVPPAAPTGAK